MPDQKDAFEDDWAEKMLGKALQLNAYAEHRVTAVATSQFAGHSSKITKAFAEAGGTVSVEMFGITPAERRTFIRHDPEKFLHLVESGYGEKAIFLLLGFGQRSEFRRWLEYVGLLERYDIAVRDSAYEFEAKAVEAFDWCDKLHDDMATLRENLTEDNMQVTEIAGSLLSKEHDMRFKTANARKSIAEAKMARLNREVFAPKAQSDGAAGASERKVNININLGSGVQGLSVDTARVIDSTVDSATSTVVSSLGINLNTSSESKK